MVQTAGHGLQYSMNLGKLKVPEKKCCKCWEHVNYENVNRVLLDL